MSTLILRLKQDLDEQGNLEEFTRDLSQITDALVFDHLDVNGLPRVGTRVSEGLLLVGKIGATKAYAKDKLPGAFEAYTLSREEYIQRWRELIYDGSLYVPKGVSGVVKAAHFVDEDDRRVAIVEIEFD